MTLRTELMRSTAQKIADRVIGTAHPSDIFVIEEECENAALTASETQSIEFASLCDDLYFCCDGCGWYCSTDELNNDTDESLCDECNE
jgi:hypothetical protein